jgi:hypothetical protein
MTDNHGNSGHPDLLITFDTETRPATCDVSYGAKQCPTCQRVARHEEQPEDTVQTLVLGWALYTALKQGDLADDETEFTTEAEFFDFVESKVQKRRILWIVNHNIAYDLMVLRFESSLSMRGWIPKSLILPDPSGPLCMVWKRDDYTIKFVNLANWWGMRPLKSIGETIGEYKAGVDPTEARYRHADRNRADWNRLSSYCRQDAYVVQHAVRVWSDFCKSHDMGTFAITQAGQSLNAYRHRFMVQPIFLHADPHTSQLEREAYMGARTECFRIGEFVGRYHVLDVNSLYPSVMLDNTYPTKLVGHLRYERQIGPTPVDRVHALQRAVENHERCLVARVSVNVTDERGRVVPTRHAGRLVYPTGHFHTVLTTRECALALARGIVVDVHELATYESGRIFTRYIQELYDLRLRYKREGNTVFTEIVKVFMNSLYGKFGQHSYQWEKVKDDINIEPGSVRVWLHDEQRAAHYRRLGDLTEQRSEQKEDSYNAFPAIAAHIIADARVRITLLRETAGESHVWYCDTDSLFTDDVGAAQLHDAGVVDDNALGKLKLEKTASWMKITGLKDYTFGDKTRLKGVRKNAVQVSPRVFRQTQFRGFAGAMRGGDVNRAVITSVTKRIAGVYNKGTIGYDGWIQPIALEDTWKPHPPPSPTTCEPQPTTSSVTGTTPSATDKTCPSSSTNSSPGLAHRPLDLSTLVQSAKPAQLIRARTGATKTTLALELVKDREPHALGPVYVSQVKEIKADIRRSALKLDMGVAVQVQTLDGTKMPDSEVNDLSTSAPHRPVPGRVPGRR